LSADSSAHAIDGEAVVAAAVVGAARVAAGLVWLGPELVPQLARIYSSTTAASASKEYRRLGGTRIDVLLGAPNSATLHPTPPPCRMNSMAEASVV
jgi:hypothetical protein